MNLLLTGAGGFLGRNLLDRLGDRSDPAFDEIHVLQRGDGPPPSPSSAPSSDRSSAETPAETVMMPVPVIGHRVDLSDDAAVARTVADIGATHLCHLAWLGPEHHDRYRSPENARWVDISTRLFDAFGEAGGTRLVHLGSCIEYGNTSVGVLSEDRPLDPDTAYAEAKAAVSVHVGGLAGSLSAAVARPFFAYGPHEQAGRLVPSIILALDRGEPIDLTEGRQRRDYLHAADIADALLALLADNGATGAFNIGAGEGVEVRFVASELGRIAGRPELLRFGARPEGADTSAEIVADIQRITSKTGWTPATPLAQGLRQTAQWWLGDPERGGTGKQEGRS